jgi:hypothetical protein
MRFAPLLAVLLLTGPTLARAGDLDFVVPDNDGYGIATCMKPGEACGQVIADAWCEAHGHAHATAFGLGDDVTGTVPAAISSPVPPGSILIRCGE